MSSPTDVPAARRATLASMLAQPRGLWRFLRDPGAPKASKVLALLTLVYVVSPVDAIPELFMPLLGWCDDVGVTAAALAFVAAQAAKYANQHPEILARPAAPAPPAGAPSRT
ncbi:MAG: DUF1232 domain-containing protein [Polyangiales bacterium]